MAKTTKTTITSGFNSTTVLNNNLDRIDNELNNKVLYRVNPVGEPNQMEDDLDMNSKDILNVGSVNTNSLVVGGVSVTGNADLVQTQFVDTVASLVTTTYISGTIVETKGYTSAGDGGGARYLIKTSAEFGGTPDGYGDHTLANGNVAVLQQPEDVNVRQFGAKGDGIADDTVSFQAAATSIVGKNINQALYAAMPSAKFATVHVPSGEYLLSTKIDPKGKDITWILEPDVLIPNIDNLNGRTWRNGLRANAIHHGILDHAATVSFNSNRGDTLDKPAGVFGITHPNQLSTVPERDSVGLYFDNKNPAPLATLSGATFTATTVVPVAPVDVKDLRVGMVIDTDHSPNKWSGIITGWSDSGSSITVSAWYEVTGTTGVAATPPSPATAYVNPFTKSWAGNCQIQLDANSHGSRAAGFELGVRNTKFSPNIGDALKTDQYIWGMDVVNLDANRGSIAYISRGQFLYGFCAADAVESSFVSAQRGGIVPTNCYETLVNASFQINCKPDGTNTMFAVRNTGTLDIGATTTASSRFMRFRSSGLATDYDSRMLWSGGTATTGQGDLRFTALKIRAEGRLAPHTDNAHSLGEATLRWTEVYAANGTINTSDAREKEQIRDLTASELATAKQLKAKLKAFKWKDAIAVKGESARWHFGVIAQEVIDIFEANGLDPFEYGAICYDEWEEQPEVKEEINGEEVVTQEYRPAGNRYGVRYEELMCFIIAAL